MIIVLIPILVIIVIVIIVFIITIRLLWFIGRIANSKVIIRQLQVGMRIESSLLITSIERSEYFDAPCVGTLYYRCINV